MKKSNKKISAILIVELIISLIVFGCVHLTAKTSNIEKINVTITTTANIEQLRFCENSNLYSNVQQNYASQLNCIKVY